MNNTRRIITSIFIVLVFLCLFVTKSNANFFTDDWDINEKDETTEIEKTIDNDDRRYF